MFDSQVETREDEEQSVKLAEILELLLAAGYFRARIKGLSPFDKVTQRIQRRGSTGQVLLNCDLEFSSISCSGGFTK